MSTFYGETVDLSGGQVEISGPSFRYSGEGHSADLQKIKEQRWGGLGHIGDCSGPVTQVRNSGFGSTAVEQRCLICFQKVIGAVFERR